MIHPFMLVCAELCEPAVSACPSRSDCKVPRDTKQGDVRAIAKQYDVGAHTSLSLCRNQLTKAVFNQMKQKNLEADVAASILAQKLEFTDEQVRHFVSHHDSHPQLPDSHALLVSRKHRFWLQLVRLLRRFPKDLSRSKFLLRFFARLIFLSVN
jgi:hypothetical protein